MSCLFGRSCFFSSKFKSLFVILFSFKPRVRFEEPIIKIKSSSVIFYFEHSEVLRVQVWWNTRIAYK